MYLYWKLKKYDVKSNFNLIGDRFQIANEYFIIYFFARRLIKIFNFVCRVIDYQ